MRTRRVVVIGGGIAGLASAYRIRREAESRGVSVRVDVVEAAAEPGGKVSTIVENGFVCEAGPAGFLDNEPATLRLVDDLKLGEQLLRSDDAARERYIFRHGRFHALQQNPLKFMSSPLLSLGGRFRVVGEFFQPPRKDTGDETVGAFGRRRLGAEFTEVMLDSMVSGIHAGDIDRLSVQAAFPKIGHLETKHGGLFKGMIALQKERKREAKAKGQKAGKVGTTRRVEAGPGGVLHSFKDGMVVPIHALASALGTRHLHLGSKVVRIARYGGTSGYRLSLEGARGEASTLDTDAIVLALPSHAAADLMDEFAAEAAAPLRDIAFAGVHVACVGYRRDQVKHPLRGFGALIPRKEGFRILGTIWSSSTFKGQAPDDQVQLRTLVGGRHDAAASELSDDEIVELVRRETEPQYGITGDPTLVKLFRWPLGIPQYELGHLDRVAQARAGLREHAGVFLTGNSVCGISFNQCIAHSEEIAREVLDHVAGNGGGSGS